MNRLIITRRELKNYEEKASWKSYVNYPEVLIAKKPEDQDFSAYIVTSAHIVTSD